MSVSVEIRAGCPYPNLRRARELALSGVGSGLLVTGFVLPVEVREVPSLGFYPSEIAWTVDRGAVGNARPSAGQANDLTRDASLLFSIVLGLVTADPEVRWSGLGRRGVVHAETLMISQGLTRLGKGAFGRPRPYAYQSVDARSNASAYDASKAGTFHSMPSGHSSSAWTGAAVAMTEHLLHRPDAGWLERAGVGFLGGALAGATSVLRVAAGQHFPSGVLVGAGIGIATGVAVPLLHRGEQPLPSFSSWAQSAGGALAGVVVGLLVARES